MKSKVSISIDQSEINRIKAKLKELRKSVSPTQQRAIIKPAAQLVIDEAKANVNVSSGPHHRYKDGVLVATYYPGNLKRSLQILGNIGKLTGSVFAGPKRAKNDTTGTFKGRRVDGWYAGIVEKKMAYLRPAFESKKAQAQKMIIDGFRKVLEAISK